MDGVVENQSNHNMMPNKTEVEHLAGNEENDDENGDQSVQRTTQLVATTSDGRNHVVSVPVSVGSLIGTAFNVITQDQLPHFKQMLCVDSNGFLSGNTIVGTDGTDLKGYVIHQQQPQQQQQQQQQQTTSAADANVTVTVQQQQQQQQQEAITIGDDGQDLNQSGSGIDTMPAVNWDGGGGGGGGGSNNPEVLSIRCKSTTAELYKSRLGSGGRGRCVKYKDDWFTPSEFENLCGRGSSKDWKRSIRYGGRSLQALIDEGILTPHATSCTCSACCDDDTTASGPVRLFTPYKRRRRNQITPDSTRNVAQPKIKKQTPEQEESEGEQSVITTKEESNWQTITAGLDVVSNDYLNAATAAASTAALAAHNAQSASPTTIQPENYAVFAETTQPFDRLTTLCAQMTKATNEFRRCINEAKEMHQRQIEKLQQERDAALLAARVHEDIEDPNGIGQIPGMDMPLTKKCANCNREAMAECSLCRRTPYCSTFCQRKDWNEHQVECARDQNEGTQQIMLLVDDQ